ncbi:MAG: co-chaperone GroES [Gammaproteobacteria bacterium RIFCSPHIGHO2_12_FULL_45_9]|nr:MAG: co-chaperone GroES [Gammaproteobacteria bacterium RIFCSPHIGHO2_12_FULL_45_9]
MSTGIQPLYDRVVVKREEERKTAGGIVIPDTATEKPSKGVVMAVGPGRVSKTGQMLPMAVKQGQRVLFGKYAGTEVSVKGETWVVMREDDLLAVIED